MRHRKRPKKPLLVVDLANLPGPKPEVEEGNEGMEEDVVVTDNVEILIAGDISETDEEGSSAVKIQTCEK